MAEAIQILTGGKPENRVANRVASGKLADGRVANGRERGKWRIEVKDGGKRYGWRRGSGSGREYRAGGKFDELSQERKAEYHRNRLSKARTKSTNYA